MSVTINVWLLIGLIAGLVYCLLCVSILHSRVMALFQLHKINSDLLLLAFEKVEKDFNKANNEINKLGDQYEYIKQEYSSKTGSK